LVWKVNVGTNVASIEASAATGYDDGTWSPSAIKLSASEIKLDGDVIVTGSLTATQISANAITTADEAETDGGTNVGSSWVQVAAIDLTTVDAGSRAMLMFSAYIDSSGDGSLMEAQIKRGSTVIWGPKSIAGDGPTLNFETSETGAISYTPTYSGMVSFFDTDVPASASSFNYKVELRVSGSVSSPWVATYKRMFGLIFKR